MRKEVFDILKKESIYLILILISAILVFKLVFFKERFFAVFKIVLSVFWLFAIPGYCILLYWMDKLEFIERFIIGIILSAAIIGVFSYYFGLLGINIKYHAILLPLIIMFIGIISIYMKKSS